ncbi:MAG: MATE family efflux transporter [Oscillospiraceae bacterium]|nr:MATE family efflux transporter [Oscillospiraceae bacterium]MBQ8670831.1 MATE family efflux transporter [Oscillospiraceae bacterium]
MQEQNKMAVMPVPKLIISMALPSMFSMLVQALYNIVDSIFVAQLGESALTAVTLAFPIQMLQMSVAVGTGVGLNSLISRRLGEGNREAADRAASHGIVLAVCSYLIFLMFGLFFPTAFMNAFAENATTAAWGVDYLSVVCIFSFGVFVQVAIEKILQATGNMVWPMVIMLTGAVTNLILDPIMIFGLFGCPVLGVKGAAIATVAGQILAFFISLWVLATKCRDVTVTLRGFRFRARTLRDIYTVGLPSIVMQSIGSVMQMGLNAILISFSEAAVSVLGAYFKLQSFAFMPVFGMTHGVMPVVGFNYGAGNPSRIKQAVKTGCIGAFIIMAVATAIFMAGSPVLLSFFNPSEAMRQIGIPALRIMALCFMPAAVGIMLSTFYQGIGLGVNSLVLSMMRQLIIILPLAWVFSKITLGLVWWAFPIAEAVALLFNVILLKWVWSKRISPLEHRQEA